MDLLGGFDSVVIEAVTQSAHHAKHTKIAGSLKDHFQLHFTFNPQVLSFLGINWRGLGNNFRRHRARSGFCRMRSDRGRSGNISAGEAAGLNRARTHLPAAIFGGRTAAKSRTGHYSRHALGSARTITVAWARWKIERSPRRDIHRLPLIATLSGNAIGIAEAPGLHPGWRTGDRRGGGTGGGKYVRFNGLLGDDRCGIEG